MAEFDLVLSNGVLYDGTGANPMRGDLGVLGDRIAGIGSGLKGRQVLDCSGLAVAPGFIDVRSLVDLKALSAPGLPSEVHQGITLALIGQDGLGPAPLRAGDVEDRRHKIGRRLAGEVEWGFRSVASYLDAIDQARPAIDLAYLVPHGAVRDSILGVAVPAQPHDLFRMKGLLSRSLDEGAFGLSLLLPRDGDAAASLEELRELATVAAARELPIVGRPRLGGAHLLASLAELFAIGRDSGAHVHVSGLEVRGAGAASVPEVSEAFATAHSRGIQATADTSPAAVRTAPLAELLAPWILDGGLGSLRARLADASERDRLRRRLLADPACEPWLSSNPGAVRLWELPEPRRALCGQTLAEAAGGRDPLLFALELFAEEPTASVVLVADLDEGALEALLGLPFICLSAGGLGGSPPAPGAGGAFPRALARLTRERRSLSLASAVRKMTGLPAESFGLDDHGYLIVGRRANAVAFDADRVRDPADLSDPARAPAGIRHVLVGGKPVVLDGQITGERPGRAVRRKRGCAWGAQPRAAS